MKHCLDALQWNNTFARLPATFHQRINPTPLATPRLAAFNPEVARTLGLDTACAGNAAFVAAINGDALPEGADPVAAIYAGYQFGVWVPQLGDGRAILLGEVTGPDLQHYDIQLKGAGPTRFSRMGDGRAVLRSCIREYLGGEAMHGLGIATTRALAIVDSSAPVLREQTERGALLVRVSPSHVRFGSFELLASRGMSAELQQLADYVIGGHFASLLTLPATERYGAWFAVICERTAALMAEWTATGFVHGVMNTDNMSILGLTLDYGPFAWMERYDRGYVPNHTDSAGRYAYDQQPRVGLWNCVRLAEALSGLIDNAQADAGLARYRRAFEARLDALMREKLGLAYAEPDDVELVGALLTALERQRTDYTRFFRALSRHSRGGPQSLACEVDVAALAPWLTRYDARLATESRSDALRHEAMLRANPKYVLRTWMAQEAIDRAEAWDYEMIEELRALLATPFDEHPGSERFTMPGESGELSCSS